MLGPESMSDEKDMLRLLAPPSKTANYVFFKCFGDEPLVFKMLEKGYMEVVQYVCTNPFCPEDSILNCRNKDGEHFLKRLATMEEWECFHTLYVRREIQPKLADTNSKDTFWHLAARWDDISFANRLLASGFQRDSLKAKNVQDNTPIAYAIQNRSKEFVQLSLKAGAKLCEACSWTDNAVQYALIGVVDIGFLEFLLPLYKKEGGSFFGIIDTEGWRIEKKLDILTTVIEECY